jgi:hypothetical protein
VAAGLVKSSRLPFIRTIFVTAALIATAGWSWLLFEVAALGLNFSIEPMPRKPIELPPDFARRFAEDMLAWFAETNSIKRDEITARQLHALRQHQGPRDKKLCVTDVIQMFVQMRDQA